MGVAVSVLYCPSSLKSAAVVSCFAVAMGVMMASAGEGVAGAGEGAEAPGFLAAEGVMMAGAGEGVAGAKLQ